ncbi:FAD-dependent monooxygenase [Actinomadura sp. 3N508]|uniref:FAD-dependent monooxygenase n=1 Tax=Actinomadura sp. 3N508 TaxID=3375153 RepID=UPI0037A9DF16
MCSRPCLPARPRTTATNRPRSCKQEGRIMTTERSFDVAVVGGGPVGMMLAAELELAHIRTVVLERLPERSPHSKAFGLHARSLESLDRRGLVERFKDGARSWDNGHFAGLDAWVDFSILDSRHGYALLSEQARTERLLEEHADAMGAELRRGHEVTGVRQDPDGVELDVSGPDGEYTLRAAYAIGCDGGRSLVRRAAGIGFPGTGGRVTARLGDVVLADRANAPMGMERTERGLLFCVPLDDTYHRVATFDFGQDESLDGDLTMAELTASLRKIWGGDLGASEPRWLSWFTDSACQAESYREGRFLLAGDAAHTHFPVGGQGLNLGLQDAFNLGWKLAATIHGWAPDGLLDTYDEERQAPARRVLENTRAQIALMNPDAYVTPLRDMFAELMSRDQVNLYLAEMISGVNVRYDLAGPEHPMLGTFAPDLELETDKGSVRLAEISHDGIGILLELDGGADIERALSGWNAARQSPTSRVRHVRAKCPNEPGLAGLLIRPDGYVAWAANTDTDGTETEEELRSTLARWFGTV